ncbi:universal stress protein [Halopiger thermotolerans]
MYDEILVPIDGSPGAESAIEHALHIARQNDATLHPLYVINPADMGDLGDEPAEIRAQCSEVTQPVIEAAREAGLKAEQHVLEGTPNERIVEYAADAPIDLIVMGTHGKSGLSRVLLGSTAEKVVRNAPVPVLTIRSGVDSGAEVGDESKAA